MDDHGLASARWHVDRYDRLRALTASRAAVLLSANALILAAVALLVPVYTQSPILGGRAVVVVLSIMALIVLVSVATSVTVAVAALLNVRPSRQLFASDVAPAMVYNHADTLRAIQGFDAFRTYFVEHFTPGERDQAIAALWSGLAAHSYRFRKLRRATRLLYTSIIALTIFAAAVIIMRTLT